MVLVCRRMGLLTRTRPTQRSLGRSAPSEGAGWQRLDRGKPTIEYTTIRYMSGSEPNAALRVWLLVRQKTQRGHVMDVTQAFLLGIMVAWTPSLIVLAVLLRDIR
jgi:hypothetical protein